MIETGHTERLAEYVVDFTYDELPNEVVRKAKAVTLDTLGVCLAASRHPTGILMAEFVQKLGGEGRSTVVGSNFKTNTVNAALANGTLGHDIIELDDNHREGAVHAGAVIVPTVLAVAEQERSNGKDFITALVLGYDVVCRIGIALDMARMYSRNFHPSSVCGCFAAAAAGKILGLDRVKMISALGLAGCQASGLIAWKNELEHYTKSFQTGIAARNAVTAALLARMGYVGPPAIFDGENNIFEAFSGEYNFEPLTRELGKTFEITRTSFKRYSSCKFTHMPVDGLLKLIDEHHVQPREIEEIIATLSERDAPVIDNSTLITHNGQYILAVAAFDKKVGMEQLNEERRSDPAVWELAKRVRILGDAKIRNFSASIAIKTKDRREFKEFVPYARGDPENPLTQEEIEKKFLDIASTTISESQAKRIIRTVDNLEKLENIAQLSDFLRVACAQART